MKNKNRNQILLRILSKSNKVMDNVVQLTMQISSLHPRLNMFLDRTLLFPSQNLATDKTEIEDYRNTLIEQLKEAEQNNLQAKQIDTKKITSNK